jgi:3',5'-cyclic AMP phosphodiesterase CpdA
MKKIIFFAFIALVACQDSRSPFSHKLTSTSKPWTAEPKPRPADDFTFAIISDLTGDEREGIFSVAVEQLKLLRPEFIMSVGDLVEGGTEDTVQLKKEYDYFDERVLKAGAPFFHVGGNHDLTNLTMRKYWEKRYGKRYYHFLYQNVLFLILDSEDFKEERMMEIYTARKRAIELLDSGKTEQANQSEYFKMKERATGEISDTQSEYFEKVIAENPNVRWTFLFLHKPVWQREEPGNLSRIEKALTGKKYTVMNGHFHEYAYTERNGQDYIMLGTTGGGQNPKKENAFDHITLVSMNAEGPSWANLRLDGILDKTAKIPLHGDTLCFQASKCVPDKKQ